MPVVRKAEVEWIGGFHTVAFGPVTLRDQLEKSFVMPKPQPSGPPMLLINPKVAFPSGTHSYNGVGFVSSGILALNAPPSSHLRVTSIESGDR